MIFVLFKKKEKTSKHQGSARMAKYPKYRQKRTYREPGKGNQIHHIKPTQVINKQTVSLVFFNCLNAHTVTYNLRRINPLPNPFQAIRIQPCMRPLCRQTDD